MRLIPVCLPLVLAPLMVAGQQAQTSTTQKPAQTSAAKQVSAPAPHKTATRHGRRHRSRKAALRKSRKRAESSAVPVDVITGGETRHIVLNEATSPKQSKKGAPSRVKVDVINGSATDTEYFSNKNEEPVQNKPVVVGVQSSDTRFAGGNKNPVVTGVTSSSSVDAKSASTGWQGVTKQVSPRPKRPTYTPDQ
ncbi:MAG: hypothetical protein JF563_00175, partial [Acidobacteriales bacterium]|nr:hypothetical protein [Terriglobales bacterium]